MQLTLDDKEINQAITDFVGNQGVDVFNKTVTVTFKSGRKGKDGAPGSGNTATIIVADATEAGSKPSAVDFGGGAAEAGEQ